MQLFVDLDGVLADFDRGYELLTGVRPSKQLDGREPDVDWEAVRQAPDFYLSLP